MMTDKPSMQLVFRALGATAECDVYLGPELLARLGGQTIAKAAPTLFDVAVPQPAQDRPAKPAQPVRPPAAAATNGTGHAGALMRTKDAALYLGVSKAHLEGRCREGSGPACTDLSDNPDRTNLRFSKQDLDAWVVARTNPMGNPLLGGDYVPRPGHGGRRLTRRDGSSSE